MSFPFLFCHLFCFGLAHHISYRWHLVWEGTGDADGLYLSGPGSGAVRNTALPVNSVAHGWHLA